MKKIIFMLLAATLFIACDKDMPFDPNDTEQDVFEGAAKELYFTVSTENLVATEGVCVLKGPNGLIFKRNFTHIRENGESKITLDKGLRDGKYTLLYFKVDQIDGERSAAEEEVEFDWTGSWNVKATENMAQVPAEFTMVVEKLDDGMGGFFYCIKEFMGADTYTLNYGGFEIIPAADGKSATITSNCIVKSLGEGNFSYIYDTNMGTEPINVTVNADGTLSIDNFSIATNAYGAAAADAKITAYYVDVTASKGVADAIESVQAENKISVADGVITIAGDAQAVQVYDAAGRLEFSGVTSSVSNLTKGIHIVKVGGTAVKVSVK